MYVPAGASFIEIVGFLSIGLGNPNPKPTAPQPEMILHLHVEKLAVHVDLCIEDNDHVV